VPSWSMLSEEEDAEYYALTEQAVDRALELDPDQSISWSGACLLHKFSFLLIILP